MEEVKESSCVLLTTKATNPKLKMDQTQRNQSNPTTYADQLQLPKKDQAIVLDAVDGLKIEDYAVAIGSIIGPINLKYISRISQRRVCMFLNSKGTVEELIRLHPQINIGAHSLEIRPLITRTQRVLISNVCPSIPFRLIQDELVKKGIATPPKILDVRATISIPGFNHVGSFRKQMFLKPEDIEKLPPNMQIMHEGTPHWIYFSSDKLACFLCKEEGHIAKNCKNIETTKQGQNQITSEDVRNSQSGIPLKINPNVSQVEEKMTTPPPPPLFSIKRHIQESITSESSGSMTNLNKLNRVRRSSSKKVKEKHQTESTVHSIDEIKIKLEPARDRIQENRDTFPLDFDKLAEFVLQTFGQKDVKGISRNFTTDTSGLFSMLEIIYTDLKDRNIKNRITRIKNRISEIPESGESSDISEETVE